MAKKRHATKQVTISKGNSNSPMRIKPAGLVYKVWVQLESCDAARDLYEDVGEPHQIGKAFTSHEKAAEFLDGLVDFFDREEGPMVLRRLNIEPMDPGVRLLAKLASIVVHCEEATSAKGHVYDRVAIDALVADHEVQDWIDGMRKMALVPLKR